MTATGYLIAAGIVLLVVDRVQWILRRGPYRFRS